MKRKLLAVLLTCCMTAGMLAGCGGSSAALLLASNGSGRFSTLRSASVSGRISFPGVTVGISSLNNRAFLTLI